MLHAIRGKLAAQDPERIALALFVAGVLVAVPFLAVAGRDYWFVGDDWSFLAHRRLSDVSTLLDSHDGHWTTLPIIQWRVFFALFGYDYLPYQLAVIASHLAVATALRLVMIRSGVRAGLVTVLSLAFVFFGSGSENILSAFQTTLNGSLFFGLVHLLLADAPQPTRRKDIAGLLAGATGLTCSGVGIGMVVAVGVAVLLSRGWRAAFVHTAPLAVFYGIWYLGYSADARDISDVGDIAQSTALGIRSAFDSIAYLRGLGTVLLVVVAVGFGAAWIKAKNRDRLHLSSVTGLLVSAVVLYVAFSYFRVNALGVDYVASQVRYKHVGAAVLLPTIAVAIDTLWTRQRILGATALLLVVVGIPGNLGEFEDLRRGPPPGVIFAVPDVEFVADLPTGNWLFGERYLTLDVLLALRADGDLPTGQSSEGEQAAAEFALALQQQTLVPAAVDRCQTITGTESFSLDVGDAIRFEKSIIATETGAAEPFAIRYRDLFGTHLVAYGRAVEVDVGLPAGFESEEICLLRGIPILMPGSVTAAEGDGGETEVQVPITLSTPLEDAVTVEWETFVGDLATATANSDYVATSGTLTFAPGQTELSVPVRVIGDTEPEPKDGETVVLRFHDPSANAALDSTVFGLGVAIIQDDD